MNCYSISLQLSILEEKLDAFQLEGNDRGVSVLTSVFYKALFKEAVKAKNFDELAVLLRHSKDTWFPKTLNYLRDEEKFILDIIESL